MKTVLAVIVSLSILGGAGYLAYNYLLKTESQTPTNTTQSTTVTKTGIITAATSGTDHTHVLATDSDTVTLNSYTVDLTTYEGQTVTVTGQYSGTTLYVDTIN